LPRLSAPNSIGIAIDPQGNLYVTEADQIFKFSPSFQVLAKWGGGGKGNGQTSGAYGLALDSAGNIYVADSGNNRIEKLSSTGQYITSWPTPSDTPGVFVRPGYLAVDAQGYVYVSSGSHGGVVQKYSPAGQLVATWR
jgi:sugar lactone lactonase YvrE